MTTASRIVDTFGCIANIYYGLRTKYQWLLNCHRRKIFFTTNATDITNKWIILLSEDRDVKQILEEKIL